MVSFPHSLLFGRPPFHVFGVQILETQVLTLIFFDSKILTKKGSSKAVWFVSSCWWFQRFSSSLIFLGFRFRSDFDYRWFPKLGGGLDYFLFSLPTWGNDPIWLIFFKGGWFNNQPGKGFLTWNPLGFDHFFSAQTCQIVFGAREVHHLTVTTWGSFFFPNHLGIIFWAKVRK